MIRAATPSQHSPPVERGPARLGRHEMLMRLGAGGMATVYLARTVAEGGFERLAALKVLHPHLLGEAEFLAMFLDEARVAARIHHPNVVAIQDLGVEAEQMYTVMDYIQGDTLAAAQQAAINLRRGIPMGVVLRVGVDALRGLDAAHNLTDAYGRSLNVVHRDATPHNILMGVDGIARVADFGIAKAESRLSFTGVGTLKGKAPYMAPEQFLARGIDHRADVYSMAITLWEALALRRCLPLDLSQPTRRPPYRPLAGLLRSVPRELDAVLSRGLKPNPDERWRTAGEFADAIEHHLKDVIAPHKAVAHFVRAFAHSKVAAELQTIRGVEARAPRSAPPSPRLRGRSGFQSTRGSARPHLVEHPLPAPESALSDEDSESPTRVSPQRPPKARGGAGSSVLVPAPPTRAASVEPPARSNESGSRPALRGHTLLGHPPVQAPRTPSSLAPVASSAPSPSSEVASADRTERTSVVPFDMTEPSRVFVSIPAPSIAPKFIEEALLAEPTRLRTVLDPSGTRREPAENDDASHEPPPALSLVRPLIPKAPKMPTLDLSPPRAERSEAVELAQSELRDDSEAPEALAGDGDGDERDDAQARDDDDAERADAEARADDDAADRDDDAERSVAEATEASIIAEFSEPFTAAEAPPSPPQRLWMLAYAAALATTSVALWNMLAR